ncbi:MAG: hypothetical protein BMS9Abin23_0516 [Thermodesulfobacteriota bacterium]|nr:MAG: hypothetical protein BMS9Abin23_0516 [Thermodesulfobacteriota bacterium]
MSTEKFKIIRPPSSTFVFALLVVFFLTCSVAVNAASIVPLSEQAVTETPEAEVVKILVRLDARPPLKAVSFDDRDGLNIMEAALMAVMINPGLVKVRERKGLKGPQLVKAGILAPLKLAYSVKGARGSPGGKQTPQPGLGRKIMTRVAGLSAGAARRDKSGLVEIDAAWREWQVFVAARLYFSRREGAQRRVKTLRGLRNVYKGLFKAIQKHSPGKRGDNDLSAARSGFDGARENLKKAEEYLDLVRVQLSHVLGIPPSVTVKLERRPDAPYRGKLPAAKALLKDMDKKRLDLIALKTGIQDEDGRLRGRILSRFPQIDVTVPQNPAAYENLFSKSGINIGIPVLRLDHGFISVGEAESGELMEVYKERLDEAKQLVPLIIVNMKRSTDRLAEIDRALPGLRKKVKRYAKVSGRGKNLVHYYRATEELLLTELLRLKYERRLGDLESALEAATGRVFVGSPQRQVKR